MANEDHYAILVAITRYPGISPLHGPENDATDFREWLLSASGGDVPEKNITRIFSSDFPPATDVQEDRPAERTFKLALEKWLKEQHEWKERVGKRLYLFLAGHGYTAGSAPNPALYTADAQLDDTLHIAGLVFAEKISNAGFFDEIVLVMDCCQDVRLTMPAPMTAWSPPDRRNTDVKLMYVLAAPRGRKSFETTDQSAPARGYFTLTFMQALRSAKAEEQPGWITARDVEERLAQLWALSGLRERYGYEPLFVAPRGLLLFPEPEQTGASPAPWPVPESVPEFGELAEARSAMPVVLSSHDSGALIDLRSASGRGSIRGVGIVGASLRPGRHRVNLRVGNQTTEMEFSADETSGRVGLPKVRFASPIPMADTSTQRPQHAAAAAELMRGAARQARPGRASLVVFARDSQQLPDEPWRVPAPARVNVTLRRADSPDQPWQVLDLEGDAEGIEGWCGAHVSDLDGGTFMVGLPLLQGDLELRQEIAVPLCEGYRTEVYIDARADVRSIWQFDVASAALRLVQADSTPSLDDCDIRAIEVARLALMDGRIGVDDATLEALSNGERNLPLLALYTAYALTLAPSLDASRLLKLCEALQRGPLQELADIMLLRGLAERSLDPHGDPGAKLTNPPCIAAAWVLAARLRAHFSRPVQFSVCVWRRASSIWTQTQIPGRGGGLDLDTGPAQLRSFLQRAFEDDPSHPQAVIRNAARSWMVDEAVISALAVPAPRPRPRNGSKKRKRQPAPAQRFMS